MSNNVRIESTQPVSVSFISTYSHKHGGVMSESLGPEALAGDLMGEFGDEVTVVHDDLQLDELPIITNRIANTPSAIVGVSVKIGAMEQLDKTLTELKRLPHEPLIVLGGVVATFASRQLLERYPNTLVAIGESEMTMRGLIRYARGQQPIENVPGIARLVEGSVKVTPVERIDLRQLHMPARLTTLRIHNDLKGLVWFEGSRGCDWHCTFCSRRELRGDGFSGNLSVDHVVDDLANLTVMGINSVHATDDDWGGDQERTLKIAEEVMARGLNIRWSVSTRADHIWREGGPHDNPADIRQHNERLRYIMERQKAAGLDRVFLGLESFSPSQLKRYGKQISVFANYKAIEILRDIGIDVVAGYIPIDPLMSLEELHENLIGLRTTGMYKKVTNPLSVLRVQEGSPYLNLVRIRERLDKTQYIANRTDDLVFYDVVNYKDPRIQVIADLADQWVSNMYPFIFGLKMEVFATTQDSRLSDRQAVWSERMLHNFRELEMQFIEGMVDHFMNGAQADSYLQDIVAHYKALRRAMVAHANDEMKQFGIHFRDYNISELLRDSE